MFGRVPALVALLFTTACPASADAIRVAVASNFQAARQLAARFEASTDHEVILVFGSTGKHFAQIRNGAPFDAFLAADRRHPELLEDGGMAVAGSRLTYAFGALVLWSPIDGLVDAHGEILERGAFHRLAIANPDLAPYGAAARQVLVRRGLWEGVESRLVRGENIAQAFQFVASGNAEIGFVALSQVLAHPGRASTGGSFWRIPSDLHSPIEQQAVLLADSAAARSFLEFVQSEDARAIIREHGYSTP